MPRSAPRLFTLVLLTGTSVLTLKMFLPMLPAMTRALDTRESVMALAVSGYMLVSAVVQIVIGPVSDRLGRRPVALGAMAAYALASLGCVLATDITLFLICRLAQAIVVGGSVLSNAVIRDQFGPREAAGKMGTIAAAMALAPMLGPMLGGVLGDGIGWRAVFGVYTALGAAALALVWLDMGETRKPGPARLRAQDYGTLLRSARYWAYALCGAFSVGAFYVFIAGVPYVASQLWHLSPPLIGLGIGSITGGYMLGASITARFAPRYGLGPLILLGRVTPSLALAAGLVGALAGLTHPLALFGATIFVGFGNGLTIANVNAGAVSVRPELAGTAAGLGGALSVAGGAGLTFVTALAMEWRASPGVLLAMMLGAVLASLGAAVVALRLDRES